MLLLISVFFLFNILSMLSSLKEESSSCLLCIESGEMCKGGACNRMCMKWILYGHCFQIQENHQRSPQTKVLEKKINKKHNNNTLVSAMTYDKQNHKLYYLQTFVNSISNTHIYIYTITSKGICSSKTKTESFSIHTHTHKYIYIYHTWLLHLKNRLSLKRCASHLKMYICCTVWARQKLQVPINKYIYIHIY